MYQTWSNKSRVFRNVHQFADGRLLRHGHDAFYIYKCRPVLRGLNEGGFTLVEVMLAASITVILAMGALGYQYFSVAHSRSSEAEITATHIAQLLVEDWKSTNGDTAYDPTGLGLGFLATAPGDFGQYLITVDNKTFYAQLTQQLVPIANNPDTVAGVTLNQLTVTVRWRTDCSRGATTIDDPTLSLITYIRCDED